LIESNPLRITRLIDDLFDPRDHLALDEAILLDARGRLRLWEFQQPTVVLGRASKFADEIDEDFCRSQGIPWFRRCSGGASVVGGPGCLMYSVVLPTLNHPELAKIDVAHDFVMTRILAAVQHQIPRACLQGICDLTVDNRKCSGNALRITRDAVLYHGTILYDFDLSLLANCLRYAPRQPAYRENRDHTQFVTNVDVDIDRLKSDIVDQFTAVGNDSADAFADAIRQLRGDRYDQELWHKRH
jgi:lipoate---protein ligase